MTALDLIAATIGALHLAPHKHGRVYDLSDIEGAAMGCTGCEEWTRTVLNDPDWNLFKQTRDDLVHRAVQRHLFAGLSDPDEITSNRTVFEVEIKTSGTVARKRIGAPDALARSRDMPTRHVSAFLAAVQAGQI
jgi:hypothetical protein